MTRKNNKEQTISYENSIKKSNELSMAKLSQGLSLNQMQLLAFAIFSTQQDGRTEFIKVEFERKFELKRYLTEHAKVDAQKLLDLKFSVVSLEEEYFEYWNVFQSIKYDKGKFNFKWTEDMIPHILKLKNHYVTTDLTITSQFKSSFSWVLYEFLKGKYGAYYISISKEALLRLFGVENRKTYQSNTGRFKDTVLNAAIKEINKYTELEVWYKEQKKGRAIVGFEIHWSTGETIPLATKSQTKELDRLIEDVYLFTEYILQMPEGENKKQALKMIRETESLRRDKNAPLTSKQARDYIPIVRHYIRKLEVYVNEKERTIKPVPFYNWLLERE